MERISRVGLLALAILVAVMACQSEEKRLAQLIQRAEAASEAEQWDAAILYFRRALQIDP
jgi:hypothetical protein